MFQELRNVIKNDKKPICSHFLLKVILFNQSVQSEPVTDAGPRGLPGLVATFGGPAAANPVTACAPLQHYSNAGGSRGNKRVINFCLRVAARAE